MKFMQVPALAAMLVLPLLLTVTPVSAAPPDAGQIMEGLRAAPTPPPVAPATRIDEQVPASTPDGVRIAVKGLRISGQTVFSEPELLALVNDAIGKEFTLDELKQLVARITGYYRQRGYLVARAYLPAQEVRDGLVEIAITEGRLGKVEINNTAGLKSAALALTSSLSTDKPLRKDELERSLLNLSDLPGVEVKSTLRPGEAIGTSDLLVEVAPGKNINGALDFDTYGNRSLGVNRLGASVYFNSPLNRGDQVSLRVQVSDEHLAYGRAGYQLPVGSQGTRIGVAWSEMRYRLGKEFASLDASGDARVGGFYVLHPFVRSRDFNLYAQAQYDAKRLVDRVGVASIETNKNINNWTVGISGDRTDAFGGGGANGFSLNFTRGDLGLDARSQAIDVVTAQSNGRFDKTNLSLHRLQRMTDTVGFYVSYAGQWADKNLDSAEKFTLGGINGVRAYPQGEANGDVGQLVTAELRWQANDVWQLKSFFDDGRGSSNRNPWGTGSNVQHLSGAGIGATFNSGKLNVNLSAAWRTGTDSPTTDTDRTPRAWLQAVRYF